MSEQRTRRQSWSAGALAVGLTIVVAACGGATNSIPPLGSGPGPSGSAAASALASAAAAASAPTAPTAKPTAAPTAKPTAAPTASAPTAPTAKPTAAPTAKPTAAPTATPIIETTSCTTADGAIKNTYPASWQTVESFPQFACMFFGNVPIVINAATGYPLAPIHVVPNRIPFAAAVLAVTDETYWRSVSKTPMRIGGLPAVLVVAVANGTGNYPANTEQYGWIIDWGVNGVIIMQTSGPEGDTRLAANKLVLDLMASKITIKPGG